MCLLLVVCVVDYCRIFLASKGNKTERSSALMLSALLGILFVILGYVYFLAWQVYVLRMEVFFNAGALLFTVLGIFLGIYAIPCVWKLNISSLGRQTRSSRTISKIVE